MLTAKYPATVFLVIVIFALSLPIFYYSQLPESAASHFNYNGEADGWMTKNSYFITHTAVILFISVLFVVLALFISKIPKGFINMPNKDYWLNDENKEETWKLIQRFLFWFGSITVGFLALIFLDTLQSNISGSNKLGANFWFYFVSYLLLTLLYTVKFTLHFSKKNIPKQPDRV